MSTIQIPIRELHARTGHFVRLAAQVGEIIVTEHGKPTARLSPLDPPDRSRAKPTLARKRRLRADYRDARAAGKLSDPCDSTPLVQETGALRDLE